MIRGFNMPLWLLFVTFGLAGCQMAELSGVDARHYLVRESNAERRMRLVYICTHLFPPVVPATARCYAVLVEKVPARADTWYLSSLLNTTPRWRMLDDTREDCLFQMVKTLTRNEPENRIRFIVGTHDPLIVAMGPETEPVQRIGGAVVDDGKLSMGLGQRLVTESDLDSVVDKLIVWDQGQRRVVALRPPVILREVLARKAWE